MNYKFISDDIEFNDFCGEARRQKVVGVDTEFVWRSTYYPHLGLIQLGWDSEHLILVDPLAIEDKSGFCALLSDEAVVKVFHEAASDLPILHRWCGAVPKNIADTRIAAGFSGHTAKLSLAKLLTMLLAVVLPKTETCSDWLQRPLTPKQLEYAGDDVVLLPSLFVKLYDEMRKLGNLEAFEEEMEIYERTEYYAEPNPDDCWKRVGRPGYLKFNLQDYAVLQRLAAWRERLAREKDMTRTWIVKDDCLAVAAVKHPYTREEVSRIQGMHPAAVSRYGDKIAEIVSEAMRIPREKWPMFNLPSIDQRVLRQASGRISSLVEKRAVARGIDAALVCTRRDAEALASDAIQRNDCSGSRLLKGWRYKLLAPAIDDICGELARRRG